MGNNKITWIILERRINVRYSLTYNTSSIGCFVRVTRVTATSVGANQVEAVVLTITAKVFTLVSVCRNNNKM